MTWWGEARPATRVVVVVLGILLGVNVVAALLGEVVGGEPGGPDGSSFATGDDGVAAWSDLLEVRGVDVAALREPLGEAGLPADATVVVVDPEDAPTPEALGALAAHLAGGGRVVAVGPAGAGYASALLGHDLGWSTGGTTSPRPTADGPLAGLDDLRGEGRGAFRTPGPTTVVAGPVAEAAVVTAGGLVAVADPTLLWNRHLAEGDNAALAVTLAGPGPVRFAEAEHGFGAARGLDAVPVRWRLASAGLVVAVLVGFWSVGQRLGPPEVADRPLPPPRHAYVDAVGAALSRTSARTPRPPSVPEERP